MQAFQAIVSINHDNYPPERFLALIRHGYALSTVRCTGAGRPDQSHKRFSRFRCNAGVENLSIPLTVRVTGRTTFRWAIA
jgi:hypothetical protein